MPAPYLLHPAFIHFPVAFLVLGFGVETVAVLRVSPALRGMATGLLGLGAGCLWIAVGLGVLAERTAPHVPSAWEVLADHETLGYVTATAFSAFVLVRVVLLRHRTPWLQWVAWLVGVALLAATAYHGGELVFGHGMGVTPPQ